VRTVGRQRRWSSFTLNAESFRGVLPTEGTVSSAGGAWLVRLPVRAEQPTLTKEVVVYERVLVRRRRVDEIVRIETEVRREELRAIAEGDVSVRENALDEFGRACAEGRDFRSR
jgi:hypothetical protein